jgi:hypothetical protein
MAKSKTEAYHVAQLEKAAEIIRIDLDRLTPAEFMKLREDLYAFCYGAGFGPARQGMLQHIALENFRLDEFLDEAKRQRKMIPDDIVRNVVEELKRRLIGIATTPAELSIPAEVTKGVMNLSAPDKSSPFHLTWNLTAEEAAMLALVVHLYGSGLTANRIRICPLESCGNLFVLKSYAREDRDHYCSPKCARNAATRRYRESKAKKQKRRRK